MIAMTVAEFFDTRLALLLAGAFGLIVLLIVANYVSRPFEKIVNGRRLRRRGLDAYSATQVPLPPELEPGDASSKHWGSNRSRLPTIKPTRPTRPTRSGFDRETGLLQRRSSTFTRSAGTASSLN